MYLRGYADVDDVLDDLQNLWPDLPAIVARRMASLIVGNEDFKHYAKERAELTFGRSHSSPPAAAVSWPTELLIAVLDEADHTSRKACLPKRLCSSCMVH